MVHLSDCGSLLGRQAARLAGVMSVLVLVSAAGAATFDFNVASGNFTTPGNWVDSTTLIPIPTAATPTVIDVAYVRNNGTVTINSDVAVLELRIGHENVVTNPDYNGNGIVDAADYVLWRKGGPLLNDATPADVGPDDYAYWRYRFGGTPLTQEIGLPGTLQWTAGEITGTGPIGTPPDPYSGGPDIRVGRVRTTNSVVDQITGTVVQNGPTTKLLLPFQQSRLTIGDGTATTNMPTSSYTLMDGTIGTAIGSGTYQNNGTNGNNGINVRNGTFNMTGGQIIDATPIDYLAAGNVVAQRFLTLAGSAGSGVGSETVATANLSGGNINSLGGIRVANGANTRGYLNINGPITIVTGGDTQLGASGNPNCVAEMNMSAGSFQVGRTDTNPQTLLPYSLSGRFHVGDSGRGTLNMSGGTINVTRELVVANNFSAAGSVINMTGGTITAGGIQLRRNSGLDPTGGDFSASIILDGPTAVLTHTGTGLSTGVTIGGQGKALFEVRQGHATLGANNVTTQLGANAISQATLNVKGGRLTLVGPLGRSNTASEAPVIGLTGGTLEFNAAASGQLWQTDFTNAGSQLITKLNALHQVTVGDATHPANFSMTSGSWDLEIGSNVTATGADRFIVNSTGGTASLTGGTLNISYIGGYTPAVNDTLRILQAPGGVTLGAVTLTGQPGWSLITDTMSTPQIQLKYVGAVAGAGLGAAIPEPSSLGLCLVALTGLLSRRNRGRASA